MANVTITGNISEPDLQYGQNGRARCTFSLAENHSRFDKELQEWKQIGTTWYRITLWEEHAENVANVLQKGDRVIAEGRSETRFFTTREGTEGSSFELHVNSIGKAIPKRAPQGQGRGSGGFGGGQQGQQSQPDPWGGQPSQGGWDTPPQDNEPPF